MLLLLQNDAVFVVIAGRINLVTRANDNDAFKAGDLSGGECAQNEVSQYFRQISSILYCTYF